MAGHAYYSDALLQASRETVSRLADYAEETNKDATDQLYELKAQLEAEKENSMSSELKFREFQVDYWIEMHAEFIKLFFRHSLMVNILHILATFAFVMCYRSLVFDTQRN